MLYLLVIFQNQLNLIKQEMELNDCFMEKTSERVNNLEIKKLYEEITSRVIDQDEPIKKILTAIWKQTMNFSENKF